MPLSPSQRVLLMKEITTRLVAEEWPLIEVTLKQFSLPQSDTWGGPKDGYLLQMMNAAPDQTLVDLARHVGFALNEISVPAAAPFWQEGMFRLFVSHLAAHRSSAANLQEVLLEYGISCFVAHNDIEPTQEWQTQIEAALATCHSLVALLHDGFHASYWTDQEVGFAMGRAVPVFAVRYGQDPYGFIGRFQAFNGNKKSAAALGRELFDGYRKNKQTQARMSDIVVRLFEESGSFAQAKERIAYLEGLEKWEPSFSSRIRSAVKSNSQIAGSWGVPERAAKLLKKRSKK